MSVVVVGAATVTIGATIGSMAMGAFGAQTEDELIEQRKSGLAPKMFESAGNDILTGDFDLGAYDPK